MLSKKQVGRSFLPWLDEIILFISFPLPRVVNFRSSVVTPPFSGIKGRSRMCVCVCWWLGKLLTSFGFFLSLEVVVLCESVSNSVLLFGLALCKLSSIQTSLLRPKSFVVEPCGRRCSIVSWLPGSQDYPASVKSGDCLSSEHCRRWLRSEIRFSKVELRCRSVNGRG